MGLLDYSRQNPWLGDALATISQGLLAYGSGNPNALAQLPQYLAERQRYRRDDQRQAKLDERQNQIFQMQLEENERTKNQTAAKLSAFNTLLPNLPESVRPVAQAMGPDFVDVWGKQVAQQQLETPKPPQTREVKRGGKVYTEEWGPQGWKEIGVTDQWKPDSDNGGIQIDTNGDSIPDIVVGGKMKPPTEFQGKSANQYTLLNNALTDVESLLGKGGVSAWRMAGSDMLSEYGPLGAIAGQAVMSPEDKQFQAARAGALESLANSITGAAFTEEQKRNFVSMLPQATDDAATSKAKLKRMRDYLAQIQTNAGPAIQTGQPAPAQSSQKVIRYDAQGNRIP